ncbi:MAG: hypothetical protein METHP_01686 [Methanoregula sp. SKADARSKE-2]|nr:MAG: hypothetical protein METHP_01686 [Methanoregula sp. SKADARSKE-2]
MLGTLTRYLRFMGYDTRSANELKPGNSREDTELLELAEREDRILLTRDAELARRGEKRAVLVKGRDVMAQVDQLTGLGLVKPRLRLTRCSICNSELQDATPREIEGADYAPWDRNGLHFYWGPHCGKLYWNGSHGRGLLERIVRGELPREERVLK